MIDNAVLRLRAERLARATRPFLARGNRVHRCQRCLLPLKQCLCATLTPAQATSRFCTVMFDTEPMKPSNTGRLIADILPDTEAFQWSRNRAAAGVTRSGRQPGLPAHGGLPASYAGAERQVLSIPPAETTAIYHARWNTDGSAQNVSQSPYLDALPVISVDLSRISAYHLREAHAQGQYCTAEVAIALLDLAEDRMARALGDHFSLFRTRYLAGKTQHKGSITAQMAESV